MSEKDFLKEKDLLLDSIEKNTSVHWKNYYKDVPIDCIYDDLVIDINEIKRLQQENRHLKERIEYLERSNNRREETIIDLRTEQQLDLYKTVLDEIREYIENPRHEMSVKTYQNLLQILDKVTKEE